MNFHGRDEYVETTVNIMTSTEEPFRLAIIGPGGMGKTTLSLAIIHDERVITKYHNRRYWVPCVEATTFVMLVEILAKSLGVPKTTDEREESLYSFLDQSPEPLILLLDNFETPLDRDEDHDKVNNLLKRLFCFPHISILMTFRGSIPPAPNLLWTRPHLPPLQPLSLDAAFATFLQISPRSKDDPSLEELLQLVDCIPLPVTLMAYLALDGDKPESLVQSWKTGGTGLLSISNTPQTSVDRSIQLSLESSLMQSNPEARTLLAILSMLPGGTPENLLPKIAPSLRNSEFAFKALRRVALAFKSDETQRIHVLSPIRCYMLHHYPLDAVLRKSIYKVWWEMVERLDASWRGPEFPLLMQKFAKEEANVHSLILDAIDQYDTRMAVKISCCWARMQATGTFRRDLLERAVEAARKSNLGYELAYTLYSYADYLSVHENKCLLALKYFEESRAIYLALPSRISAACVLMRIGKIYHTYTRELQKAVDTYKEALKEAKTLSDPLLEGECLFSIASVVFNFTYKGYLGEIRGYLEEASEIFSRYDSLEGIAQCSLRWLDYYGRLVEQERCLANTDKAEEYFIKGNEYADKAEEIFSRTGQQRPMVQCFWQRAILFRMHGSYEKALELCIQGINMAKFLGDVHLEMLVRREWLMILVDCGRKDECRPLYVSIITYFGEDECTRYITVALNDAEVSNHTELK
jgi:tetratricopeptide (TPR) repeat protein